MASQPMLKYEQLSLACVMFMDKHRTRIGHLSPCTQASAIIAQTQMSTALVMHMLKHKLVLLSQ